MTNNQQLIQQKRKHEMLDIKSFRASRGVTLIELMIVIAIVGILGMVAYPSYENSMQKTRRADGIAALLTSAQTLERCYTEYNKYNHANCSIQTATSFNSSENFYSVSVATTTTTFTLSAGAQGAQSGDSSCTPLTISQTGAKLPADCW